MATKLKMRDVISREVYNELTPEERRHILKRRNMCYYTIPGRKEKTMNHQIKLFRARKYAGTLPMATEHILRNIPKSVIDKLTGREIAELMQAMHKHYHDGIAQGTRELADYIGLPAGVDIWAVIGDADYLGYKTFDDGLSLPEILAARGRQVAAWKAEEREKPE